MGRCNRLGGYFEKAKKVKEKWMKVNDMEQIKQKKTESNRSK
jgi:hypothetical protein